MTKNPREKYESNNHGSSVGRIQKKDVISTGDWSQGRLLRRGVYNQCMNSVGSL